MVRNVAPRALMSVVVALGLVGCRAFQGGGLFSRCSSCQSSAVATVGDSYLVGDGMVASAGYGDPGGCTTCQKAADVPMVSLDGDESEFVESDGGLVLPGPDGSEPAYTINPTPDEQPVKPEAKPEVAQTPEQPTKPIEIGPPAPPTPTTTVAKPSALNLDVKSSVSVAMVGQEVVFDVTLANVGGAPIESIDLTATFSDGLRPKTVTPMGVSKIDGQRVSFDAIRSLAPMTLSYRIVAEAMPGMSESRLTVEVASPILTSGSIKREQVVRLTP